MTGVQTCALPISTQSKQVTDVLMEAAYTGLAGDGIVAVLPVEKLYHIGARADAPAEPG